MFYLFVFGVVGDLLVGGDFVFIRDGYIVFIWSIIGFLNLYGKWFSEMFGN